tara:strand:- start:394 stop:579 length:186 start_codon:yes stop_codon:yes gene_type:complete
MKKTIEFRHKGVLLQFVIDESNKLLEINRGSLREKINSMSRNYQIYQKVLKNKLGGLIEVL